jgi:proteasome lid subunit RPN8/RPN11
MKALKISNSDWLSMKQHVEAAYPLEACGLLAGNDHYVVKVIAIRNIAPSIHRYRMDPAQQVKAQFDIEESGLDLLAIYHSHPEGGVEPSVIDIAEWSYQGVRSLIWSKDGDRWTCSAFAINELDVHPVGLTFVQAVSDRAGES